MDERVVLYKLSFVSLGYMSVFGYPARVPTFFIYFLLYSNFIKPSLVGEF